MDERYSRRLGTAYQKREDIAEIANIVNKYLEVNKWSVQNSTSLNWETGIRDERLGSKVLIHDNGLCITFNRFQKNPGLSPYYDFRAEIYVDSISANKSLVDKVSNEILTLHRLLNEIKL
jgi:hypothetical protein